MLYIAARLKGIFNILFQHYHIPLVISALLGIGLGAMHRHLGTFFGLFLFRLSITYSDRQALFQLAQGRGFLGSCPALPTAYYACVVVRSSRVIMILSRERWWLTTMGLTCIGGPPIHYFCTSGL